MQSVALPEAVRPKGREADAEKAVEKGPDRPRMDPSPRRVVVFSPAPRGGICHYTYQLAEALAKTGADVTVFTSPRSEIAQLPGSFAVRAIHRPSLIRKILSRLGFTRRKAGRSTRNATRSTAKTTSPTPRDDGLLSRVRRQVSNLRLWGRRLRLVAAFSRRRPHVIHLQWLIKDEGSLRFVRLLRRLGFRVVLTSHNIVPHDDASPAQRRLSERIFNSVDHVIVHAEANRREILEHFTVEPDRIGVIPHGSYDFFQRNASSGRSRARRELGIPLEARVVLFFGLIRRYKGLEYLTEAFETVEKKVEHAFLLIGGKVGEHDAEDHRFYSGLLRRISERPNVKCVDGYVPVEKVPDLLVASDVVALPYVKTYQSGVLLLAYASGRPVVVTRTGGLAEVVEEGRSGYVVPPQDSAALAEALVRILADRKEAESMGKRARHLAETKYSWDSVARRTLEVYDSVRRPVG